MKTLEVLFTPADFNALRQQNLAGTVCVVFDVLRATSSMITALANGAAAIIPVAEIPEALALRREHPDILLAGERDGLRIRAALTGGVDFDLGNSPREFMRERVVGKTIAITTTNGTRALRACAPAKTVLIGSFLNLRATADFILQHPPETLLLVCSGTLEQASLEDVLGAGALCDLLWDGYVGGAADSALMARQIFQQAQHDLLAAAGQSRNGRRLLSQPELRDDVLFCLQRDLFNFTAAMCAGKITRTASNTKFLQALRRFDGENSRDPNLETVAGSARPRELVYAERLTDWVLKLCPEASEPLRLAARCQHLCRWMSPRSSFPMTRPGYLQWRAELKKFHAQKSGEILREVGYSGDVVERVQNLNLKKNFPGDPESRVLEDALCLVFLEHQLADLAAKTEDEKVIVALQKSWKKMTPAGHAEALKLHYGPREKALLDRALAPA